MIHTTKSIIISCSSIVILLTCSHNKPYLSDIDINEKLLANICFRLEENIYRTYISDDNILLNNINDKYELLLSIISDAEYKISQLPRYSISEKQYALLVFYNIHDLLINKYKFKLKIGTETLLEALTYNKYDCDIGSLIYFSIGEKIGLPIYIVEAPGHNFVRWELNNHEHINWDVNTGKDYSDDDFRNGNTPTSTKKLTIYTEMHSYFLKNLPINYFIGYYYGLLAYKLNKKGKLDIAEIYYKQSIQLYPYAFLSMNNLAWMYVTNEKYISRDYANQATNLTLFIVNSYPEDINSIDTLSCCYAAQGNFEQAIFEEKKAYSNKQKIEGFKNKKTCLDMKIK